METKEIFVAPAMEVVVFSEQDIVTTSGLGGGVVLPDDDF